MNGQASSACDAVIVNFNAGALLGGCVGSLLPQGAQRVIVVDNASGDDSLDLLQRSYGGEERLQIMRNPRNFGFARACNAGAAASSAPFLLFLNPDCVLAPGALERMIQVLAAAPGLGMAGGLLTNPDGSEQIGGRRRLPTPWSAFVRAFGLARAFPRLFLAHLVGTEPLPDRAVQVEAISGACMLVRRDAMNDVGPWDEQYFLHCEDLDWCMRFRQKGWGIAFVPDARVVHQKGACSRSRPIFVEWHKHRGMMRYYRKFHRQAYPGAMMWLVAVGIWLRFGAVATYHGVRGAGRALGGWRG